MNSMRFVVSLCLLLFTVASHAQIEDLPETATGARALPFVHVEMNWWGAYVWGHLGNSSVKSYIWGEAGEAIDDLLDDLGIDIENDEGVLYYTILFEVTGLGLSAPISVSGEISKEIGEDLEEAFQRNYGDGGLQSPTGPPPQNFTPGYSGGGLDVGTLGSNSNWTPSGYAGVAYYASKPKKGVVTISDLN